MKKIEIEKAIELVFDKARTDNEKKAESVTYANMYLFEIGVLLDKLEKELLKELT